MGCSQVLVPLSSRLVHRSHFGWRPPRPFTFLSDLVVAANLLPPVTCRCIYDLALQGQRPLCRAGHLHESRGSLLQVGDQRFRASAEVSAGAAWHSPGMHLLSLHCGFVCLQIRCLCFEEQR